VTGCNVKLGAATTPGRLRLQLGVLLLGTIAVWVFGTALIGQAHAVVTDVAADNAPAEVADMTAHADPVDADRAAVFSFLTDNARLGGPGQRYQNDITGARQTAFYQAVLRYVASPGQLETILAELEQVRTQAYG